MTITLPVWAVPYLLAGIVAVIVAVGVDIPRRKVSWWWILLPILLGPPGGMAYFIARPPYRGDD